MTFGDIVSFFRIAKDEDKTNIANLFNIDSEYIYGWLLSFVEIRNICAHNNRLYNIKLKQKPYLYRSSNYDIKKINREKVFPFILTIRRFFNCDSRWTNLRDCLIEIISEYRDIINFNYFGFPANWEDILLSNM